MPFGRCPTGVPGGFADACAAILGHRAGAKRGPMRTLIVSLAGSSGESRHLIANQALSQLSQR